MKKKWWLVIGWCGWLAGTALGQNDGTHGWLSLQAKFKSERITQVLEAGHRREGNFISYPKQYFGRYILNYQSGLNSIGVGMAVFHNLLTNTDHVETEIRPSLEWYYSMAFKTGKLQVRVRDEIRIFDRNTPDNNRLRFQQVYTFPSCERIRGTADLTHELLYSFLSKKPWEWRLGVKYTQRLSRNVKGYLHYQYQNNSGSSVRNNQIVLVGLTIEFLLK